MLDRGAQLGEQLFGEGDRVRFVQTRWRHLQDGSFTVVCEQPTPRPKPVELADQVNPIKPLLEPHPDSHLLCRTIEYADWRQSVSYERACEHRTAPVSVSRLGLALWHGLPTVPPGPDRRSPDWPLNSLHRQGQETCGPK